MSKIYEQFDAAFRNVEASLVFKGNKLVAKVCFKFPANGAGRLYAYVHWFGLEMVRGYATGGGYDKRTAACASAMPKLRAIAAAADGPTGRMAAYDGLAQFEEALAADRGPRWDSALASAGFTVWNAI